MRDIIITGSPAIAIIIIIIGAVFAFMFWQQWDCYNRTMYWNDRGFFIDVWEFQWQQCQYEPIPKDETN